MNHYNTIQYYNYYWYYRNRYTYSAGCGIQI